jgi:hypothetical protein
LFFTLTNWLHNGLHQNFNNNANYYTLAGIEYAFHFPWFLSSILLVYAMLRINRAYGTK